MAKHFPGFNGDLFILKINSIDELFGQWEDFKHILHETVKWVGTQVYFNSKLILPLNNEFYYKLQEIYRCYYTQARIEPDRNTVCQSRGWNCILLESITGKIENHLNKSYWYEFGSFETSTTWKVDKDKIREILKNEAELKHLSICPFFNISGIEKDLSKLPDRIYVDNENWGVECEINYLADGKVKVPKCVIPLKEVIYINPVLAPPTRALNILIKEIFFN